MRKIIQNEAKNSSLALISLVCLSTIDLDFNFTKFSSYSNILNIMSYILRFSHNCRNNPKRSGPFSIEEIQDAEMRIIYVVQRQAFSEEIDCLLTKRRIKDSVLGKLQPFLDVNGMVRISTGSCENNSVLSYNSKYPLLIPAGHLSELFLRFQHLFLKHASFGLVLNTVRDKYWIMSGRRTAMKVIDNCPRCNRYDSRPIQQPSPALPSIRANQCPPFTICGVDHAGPIFVKDLPGHKFYILLFTCGVVRAIHLELVDSLDLHDTVLAFRRFAARRGLPSIVYSDNSKTFEATQKHFRNVYGFHTPQWRNIPPISPWWGGWWERLVRTVKNSLKKTLHSELIPHCEMSTVITEIEAVVNSRPLTTISPDHRDPQALTPSHFLIGKTFTEQYNVEVDGVTTSAKDIGLAYQVREGCLNFFWETWLNEYLRNLPHGASKTNVSKSISLGSLVLVRQDNLRRLHWPIGRIVKTLPGADNIVRAIDVKMPDGTIVRRSVNKLHFMETFEPDNVEESCEKDSDDPDISNVQTPSSDFVAQANSDNVNNSFLDIPFDSEPLDTQNCQGIASQSEPSSVSDRLSSDLRSGENDAPVTRTRLGRQVRPPSKLNL